MFNKLLTKLNLYSLNASVASDIDEKIKSMSDKQLGTYIANSISKNLNFIDYFPDLSKESIDKIKNNRSSKDAVKKAVKDKLYTMSYNKDDSNTEFFEKLYNSFDNHKNTKDSIIKDKTSK